MSRRKRGQLSDEDREIWLQIARTTKPLHVQRKMAAEVVPKRPPEVPVSGHAPSRQPLRPLTRIGTGGSGEPRVTVNVAPDPMQLAETPRHQLDRKNYEKLRRGKIKPEGRLDLHGMTAAQAHGSLTAFIHRSHAAGKRLVLVITGKGNTVREEEGIMPTRQGVLRHSLPYWLDAPHLRPMILEITPAHARHGGGGAYYVYLRRKR